MDEQRYLIAEDLLLLLLDDERGRLLTDPINVDAGLAGAILLELAQRQRVKLHETPGLTQRQIVQVHDASTTDDDLLDEALHLVAERDRTAIGVVEHLVPGLRRKLLDRLAARGILEHEEGRLLGIFPRHRWPAHDDRHEMALRAGIRDSLVQGGAPTERVAALIALLDAIGAEHRVLPFPGVSNRQLRARAGELSKQNAWAAGSTQSPDSVDVVSATRAAIAATTIAASSSSPGGG